MDNSVTNPSFEMAGPEPKARKNILTQIFPWVVLFFLAALVITPIFSLVAGSFSLSRLPNEFSLDNLGFDNFYAVWIEQRIDRVIWNTTIYVIGATVFGVTTAGVLAWLVERSDMPGKTWIYAGVPLGIAVPGILHAIAWVLLLSPRSGFVNRAWMDVTGSSAPLFDIYTMGGLIFAEGLRLVPVAFLMLVPLMRSMDPAMEVQAITAMENFEVPGVLGMPVNLHVFSTRVYNLIDNIGSIPAFGQANAAAIFYLVIALIISFFYLRLVRSSEKYSTITGKGFTPRKVALGRWRKPCVAAELSATAEHRRFHELHPEELSERLRTAPCGAHPVQHNLCHPSDRNNGDGGVVPDLVHHCAHTVRRTLCAGYALHDPVPVLRCPGDERGDDPGSPRP